MFTEAPHLKILRSFPWEEERGQQGQLMGSLDLDCGMTPGVRTNENSDLLAVGSRGLNIRSKSFSCLSFVSPSFKLKWGSPWAVLGNTFCTGWLPTQVFVPTGETVSM